MTGPLVVPLGRYLGLLPVGRPSGPVLEHTVRVGGRRLELADDDHLVWALAHGIPGVADLDGWDRAALRLHLPQRAAGTDVDAAVDRLVGAGLLREVDGPAEEFARTVRLLPQAVGLGNTVAYTRTFSIGHPGTPLVAVPTEVFYLWSWACLHPDLWTACVAGARAAVPAGAGDPRELATMVLGHLHTLLSANVACLDAAAGAS